MNDGMSKKNEMAVRLYFLCQQLRDAYVVPEQQMKWQILLEGESWISLIDRFDASKFPTKFSGQIHGFSSDEYIDGKNDRRLDDCLRYTKGLENADLAGDRLRKEVCGMHRALSQRNNDPQSTSRSWDKERDGFVISEGVCVLVMESLEHAIKRGAMIIAEYLGVGHSDDERMFWFS
ncbi:3-oxoacyl-[acyl-carrier-protein] synthase I, chloroplastic [Capsicum baccatum]|uniref:beta-ketoacyl-[acyl-carrier-protein] synthase I n=1 Tax=Capsicum baccatum TaxID=33114 RepID=A0A2G2XDC1_CAPBA|nr:3-oxoacyl-[acyl-carrier-protein] synthase I, chloroplastic [Capsicum baccatum]